MRNALLEATVGLCVAVGIASTAGQANAQLAGDFDLSYSYPQTNDPDVNPVCAGVAAGNMANGTKFVTWTCNANAGNGFTGARDQAFFLDYSDYIERGGFFFYSVRESQDSNKCMGVSAGSTHDDATVVIWDCLEHLDQYWNFFPDEYESGCYFLYNYNTDMWLGVTLPGGYGGVGTGDTLVQTDDANQTSYGVPIPWCPHTVSP
jgi:hypothetical protein